jgi:dihydroorotase
MTATRAIFTLLILSSFQSLCDSSANIFNGVAIRRAGGFEGEYRGCLSIGLQPLMRPPLRELQEGLRPANTGKVDRYRSACYAHWTLQIAATIFTLADLIGVRYPDAEIEGVKTMMNRRDFVYTATAAGAVMFARGAKALAASYDLIVKGGRVVDPSRKINAILDVAITGGRIAAVTANIEAGTVEILDARSKIVVPGLLDVHTHYARDNEGPKVALSDGVTGWIDAGSQGADHIDEAVAVVKAVPQTARLLINIDRMGIAEGVTDLIRADVGACKEALARNRDVIAGVKARLSKQYAGDNDVEILRRAIEVAKPFNLPVMIHIGQSVSPLGKLLDMLRPGDIVSHIYAPPPHAMLDDNGQVIPEALAARRRGVWFDVANGRGHVRWDMVDGLIKAGFLPDTISTDGNTTSRTTGVVDLPNVMSKLLVSGMTLDQVVACTTINAARVFPILKDRGTLKVGAPADIAILELRQGSFEFVDTFKGTRTGSQKLFPSDTLLGGKRAPRV